MLDVPQISVAICTYNRADRLVFALESLSCQSLPIELFEILVIDNASVDNTKEVCSQFQAKLNNLHYIYEPIQGLSKARNTALKSARGEYIAYLDDDAIPCPIWLETLLQTFKTVEPQPVCVGGAIYPLWEDAKPDWLHEYMEPLFSILDYGKEPRWFKPPTYPIGANMTYQREALSQIGGFSEELGRQGQSLLSHEEYFVDIILEGLGKRFYYQPLASVQHWIPKERCHPNWLMRRSYWQGRSEALAETILGKSGFKQYWLSLWKLLNLKRLLAQFWPDQKVRVRTRSRIYWRLGYFVQTWFK